MDSPYELQKLPYGVILESPKDIYMLQMWLHDTIAAMGYEREARDRPRFVVNMKARSTVEFRFSDDTLATAFKVMWG
jgi:hypothetical protein